MSIWTPLFLNPTSREKLDTLFVKRVLTVQPQAPYDPLHWGLLNMVHMGYPEAVLDSFDRIASMSAEPSPAGAFRLNQGWRRVYVFWYN